MRFRNRCFHFLSAPHFDSAVVLSRRSLLTYCNWVAGLGLADCDLSVGIGIHAGELSFGEFGWSHCDLTAIGTVINTASLASPRRR